MPDGGSLVDGLLELVVVDLAVGGLFEVTLREQRSKLYERALVLGSLRLGVTQFLFHGLD